MIDFFKRKALGFSALDVLNKLISCGILRESGGNIYFQEYFFAVHLRSNSSHVDEIINENPNRYHRELYLLSGLRRQNADLLKQLRKRLEGSLPTRLSDRAQSEISAISSQDVYDPTTKKKKLTALKTKKLNSTQVDNFLDQAEKEISTEDEKELIETKTTNKRLNDTRSEPVADYMQIASLYGAIVKNSEFDDGALKATALEFYLERIIQYTVYVSNIMTEIVTKSFEQVASDSKSGGKKSAPEEISTIKSKLILIMHRIVITIITLKVSQDIGTEKLHITYSELIKKSSIPNVTKLLIALVMYDMNQPGWVSILKEMIDLNNGPFMLELVTERLWYDLYTRFESEPRREQISDVVDHITRKMGGDKRSNSRQAVERVALLNRAREN